MGTTEEYKTLDNFKQISYIFVGKVLEDTKQLNVTQKEKDEGAKLVWETPYAKKQYWEIKTSLTPGRTWKWCETAKRRWFKKKWAPSAERRLKDHL